MTLLNRGSGGVVDIRETVALYDEQSPLYGFVHYRRRKVILKYVPEGTSRLLRGTPFTQLKGPYLKSLTIALISTSRRSLPSHYRAIQPTRYHLFIHIRQGAQRCCPVFGMLTAHCLRFCQILQRFAEATRAVRDCRGY